MNVGSDFNMRVNTYPAAGGEQPMVILRIESGDGKALPTVDVKAHGWPGRSHVAARDLAVMLGDMAQALREYASTDPGTPYTGMTPVATDWEEKVAEADQADAFLAAQPEDPAQVTSRLSLADLVKPRPKFDPK